LLLVRLCSHLIFAFLWFVEEEEKEGTSWWWWRWIL